MAERIRTVAVPEIGPEERARALEEALAARRRMAAIKTALKRGEMSLSDALSDDRAARIPVRDLLRSLPGMGPARAERAMAELGIAQRKRTGGLGPRQRERLVEWFRSTTVQ